MNEIVPNQPEATITHIEVKPSYKIHNWIVLVYVILLVVTYYNQNENLANILFFVMGGFGLVTAVSFVWRMLKLSRSVRNPIVDVFLGLIGILGGTVIFLIAACAALTGVFRHISLGGD